MPKGRRQGLNFSTAVSGVPVSDSVTLKKQIPFRFRIAYLYIKNMVGQAYLLQVRVFVGNSGSTNDVNVLMSADDAVDYVAGDDDEIAMYDLDPTVDAHGWVTVVFTNASAVDALTGKCIIKVEEVTE